MRYPFNKFSWDMLRYKLRRLRELPHRALHGWAPTDTWNLSHYLAQVMGESLLYLAKNHNGAPVGYPSESWENETDFQQWADDLERWAAAFREYAEEDSLPLSQEETERRYENLQRALKEIQPWFTNLWD